jgi:hypothetical protein
VVSYPKECAHRKRKIFLITQSLESEEHGDSSIAVVLSVASDFRLKPPMVRKVMKIRRGS